MGGGGVTRNIDFSETESSPAANLSRIIMVTRTVRRSEDYDQALCGAPLCPGAWSDPSEGYLGTFTPAADLLSRAGKAG